MIDTKWFYWNMLSNQVCRVEEKGPIFVHWKVSHTHTDTNADGSFTLSVCLLCCQTFKYLHPKVWAKVNKVPSKTSHFPCHLLKTGGPRTHRHPRSLALSFFFLFLQQSKHVLAAKLQSLPMSGMQQLGEIHWLFRGPKLGTTLKCRLPLRFLIVHRFYASCHHIPLTLSHFNLSPFLSTSKNTLLQKRLSCHRQIRHTLWLP